MRLLTLGAFGLLSGIACFGQDKPRVFVGSTPAAWGNTSQVEAQDRSLEVEREMAKRCKGLTITRDINRADYVVEATRRLKNGIVIQIPQTDISVYRSNADLLFSETKGSVSSAAEAACKAIEADKEIPPPPNPASTTPANGA